MKSLKLIDILKYPKVNGDGNCYCGEPCTCGNYEQAIHDFKKLNSSRVITAQEIADICTKVFCDYWTRYKSNPSGEVFAEAILSYLQGLGEK